MSQSITLHPQVSVHIDHKLLLKNEQCIQAIMNASPWICPSDQADVIDAVQRLVPGSCGKPLIRLGGNSDGAYLVPDHMDGIDACFSPGVSRIMRFEEHLAREYGIESYMCDASVQASQLPLSSGSHHFSHKWLGSFDHGDTQSLDTWVTGSAHSDSMNLLLQMDIEGAEYSCLLASSRSVLSRFRIIVVELHGLDKLSQRRFLNMQFLPVITKLHELFDLVHIHPNNCCGTELIHGVHVPKVLEATFYRKSENTNPCHKPKIPHPLDIINVRGKLPIQLQEPWRTNDQ